ncbi:MAG: phosphatidate cytidylyltransferase [Haliscomenobacter sp.]|nr:phosphatidate cytidylyltransferase [Haliscomenobacter sp.]
MAGIASCWFSSSPLGDLWSPLFKRSRQIKDTGNLLPGFGGILDSFDGFIFHLPFTAG